MPAKSSIARLPADIHAKLDQLIREQQLTIDEIVAEVQAMGGEVKRTAVADYKKKMEERLKRVHEAQEIGGVWAAKLGENPDSPMGRLVAEVIKTVAFRTITELDDNQDNTPVSPEDLMLLAKALQSVTSAQKADHEFRLKLRAEFVAEMKAKTEAAATEVSKEARAAGLTPEAEANLRKIVLGVVG